MADLKYITTQTSKEYSNKKNTWKLISDSYAGGQTYKDGDYLHKFTLRESTTSYDERKKRAIYFNNTKPLADLLMGFLYTNEVYRTNFKQIELIENATRTDTLDSFMQIIALNSLLYTTGILVDSPKFDTDIVRTEADRKALNLNPYCVMYKPWLIRNYCVADDNKLSWILLDNSYTDNTDPFKKSEDIKQYRLWTREYYQDFTSVYENSPGADYGFIAGEPSFHNLGEVPFIFANWSSSTDDKFQSTIFEDVAFFDQGIYNYMSLSDEMLVGGTFKFLFYPGKIPEELKSQGFSNLAVIPFDDQAAHEPKFDGPALSDINPFLQYMEFLLTGILRKLGLNTDMEKNYVQSGEAKAFDFTKTRALLSSGAESMEQVEKEIFRMSGLWMGIDDSSVEIEYQKDFLGDEMIFELEQLYNLLSLPYTKLKEFAAKRISSLILSNSLSDKEMDEIYEDINKESESEYETREAGRLNIQNLAQQEKGENNNGSTEQSTDTTGESE